MSAGGKPLAHLARALLGALALGLLACPAVAKDDKGKDKHKLEAILTGPAAGALYTAPATIALSARALAKQGNHPIVKVEFFQGATPIGTVNGPQPDDLYRFSWTSVGAGTYRLTAKATNDKGDTDTSAAVTVTVNAAAAQLYFIHADHVGTPRQIYNEQQQLVWRRDNQEPFGDSPADENPSGLGVFEFDLGFPGQRRDRETGLWYNGQRDGYDPAIGGYTQPDAIGIVIPQAPPMRRLNHLYAYARSNPLSFIDPDGLCPCPGGIWDQELGDFGFQVAVGGYISVANINLTCRGNKSLKCSGKQMCIGGGPMLGGGVGWTLGGEVTGANDSSNLSGWGGFGGALSAGPFSGQADSASVQTSVGISWRGGGALIRCLNYYMKCNCPCE